MRRINKENLNLKIKTKNGSFTPEAIFIDLDGTLFDKLSKNPSRKNIDSVKKIQEIVPVVVSTGRSLSVKVKHIMKLLNVPYAICQNGAVIVNNKNEVLKNITLNKEQVESTINIVKKYNRGFTINSKFLVYTNHKGWFLFRTLWWNKWKKIDKYYFKENFVNKIVIGGYLKKKKIWELAKEIEQSVKNVSVKTSGRDKVVEITHEDATKGNGDEFVANLLNVNIKKTIHIGDSENDSTTIDKVGALIAMEDSSSKLLNVATHLGPKHKRGGVSKILNGEFEVKLLKKE